MGSNFENEKIKMKNKKPYYTLKFLSIIYLFIPVQSCTIQKRTFNKGYFVQWNLDKNNFQKNETDEESKAIIKSSSDETKIKSIEFNSQILNNDEILIDLPIYYEKVETSIKAKTVKSICEKNQKFENIKEKSKLITKKNTIYKKPYKHIFNAFHFFVFLLIIAIIFFTFLLFLEGNLFLLFLFLGAFFLGGALFVLYLELSFGISSQF